MLVIQFAHPDPASQYGVAFGQELHVDDPSYLHSAQ